MNSEKRGHAFEGESGKGIAEVSVGGKGGREFIILYKL